jgi:hypothetical protein
LGELGIKINNLIVIKLKGGLGNQLFQYATAKALSIDKKSELFLDKSSYIYSKTQKFGLDNFNLELNFYKKNKWLFKLGRFLKLSISYQEKKISYDSSLFNLSHKNIFLEGYFQSEIYFNKYRDEFLKDFKLLSPLKIESKKMLEILKKRNSVSLHFRRGDYLLKQNEIHNVDKSTYYKEAVEYIESKIQNPVYFVFSDDMDWVKKNFKSDKKIFYVDFNDAATNYEDLILMSSCKHNIITNSSFSWWGAWLNTNEEKIVVAPKKWFNGNELDYSDIVPKQWYKI